MSHKISLKTKMQFPSTINYLLKLLDGRICLCYGNTISILNKNTFKPEITKSECHKKDKDIISLSQLEDGKLISCAKEPNINIYNIKSNILSIHQTINIFSNLPCGYRDKKKF